VTDARTFNALAHHVKESRLSCFWFETPNSSHDNLLHSGQQHIVRNEACKHVMTADYLRECSCARLRQYSERSRWFTVLALSGERHYRLPMGKVHQAAAKRVNTALRSYWTRDRSVALFCTRCPSR
jgi:hypothetical protein